MKIFKWVTVKWEMDGWLWFKIRTISGYPGKWGSRPVWREFPELLPDEHLYKLPSEATIDLCLILAGGSCCCRWRWVTLLPYVGMWGGVGGYDPPRRQNLVTPPEGQKSILTPPRQKNFLSTFFFRKEIFFRKKIFVSVFLEKKFFFFSLKGPPPPHRKFFDPPTRVFKKGPPLENLACPHMPFTKQQDWQEWNNDCQVITNQGLVCLSIK